MTFAPHGKNLIAGDWLTGDDTFTNEPTMGKSHTFTSATNSMLNAAAEAAEAAFAHFSQTSRRERADFLNEIADQIEARAAQITFIGTIETGLPSGRLEGERGRTTGQLRLFAQHILETEHLDIRHDDALPEREPLPRPELRMVQRPIGPVGVFGASNFPLAFSTAGGDTAAALAAGCPVVVKGHPAHPGTGEIVAEAIKAAITECRMHPGVFSLLQGVSNELGAALVTHPLIKAVGFTGSQAGGRALFDLCAARPDPIPFFGELGSINPMFVLNHAAESQGSEIATGWVNSLTMGAGQFCTNPGVSIIVDGPAADQFVETAVTAVANIEDQTMLTGTIAKAFHTGCARLEENSAVRKLFSSKDSARSASPILFETSGESWLQNSEIWEEVFGPLGIVIRASNEEEVVEIANKLNGQLTCTIHIGEDDTPFAQELMPILERKAGRLLANGFPTGVEVCDSMVHGGPYPASTNFGATSVGTLAIRRFLRPVCYQNMPTSLLPSELQ